MSRPIKSQIFHHDESVPQFGEIILVRLAEPISGPGSTAIPNSSISINDGALAPRPKKPNYRNALVLGTVLRRELELEVWPIPSYSQASASGFESSVHWVNSLSPELIEKHIPLPSTVEPPAPTPPSFGQPLQIEGFQDRRHSWVFLEKQEVAIRSGQGWKRFDPPVKISYHEVDRLLQHSDGLSLKQPQPSKTEANQEDHLGGGSVGSRFDNAAAKHKLYDTNDSVSGKRRMVLYCDDDGDEATEDGDYESGDGVSPIGFARMWAPYNPHFAKIVNDYESEERRVKHEGILEWVGKTF